jgi:caa(3)-type oxidase subunit IV
MEHRQHPSRPHPNYVGIFGWLTGFTVIELIISVIGIPAPIQIGLLVLFAVAKASLVVLYYMHLRYDNRWYAAILLIGVFFSLIAGRFLPLIQK